MSAGCDIGLIGLGVMGRNLALNLRDHGYQVAVHDAAAAALARCVEGTDLVGCSDGSALVAALKAPHTMLLMVPAGPPVDEAIALLSPSLTAGDIVLDGGNSHFLDTRRREKALSQRGVRYLGVGISGGEAGARDGPAIMAGGAKTGYDAVKPLLEAIAARAHDKPCCGWFGADGAGHFVKMMHNGIEYADMQLIAETVFLLRRRHGLAPEAIADLFAGWNATALDSYLIEITATVLRQRDGDTGKPLVDVILDHAGQKGTGQWASVAALELGVPAPTIIEAVEARALSALQPERVAAAAPAEAVPSAAPTLDAYRDALLGAKIAAYAQGFAVLQAARAQYGWALDLPTVARVWQGGCIIRARLLGDIERAVASPALTNLLRAPALADVVARAMPAWRRVVGDAIASGVSVPALGSALAYVDAYHSAR
ncbi:MAG: NADP-dependent phosphogluconate dehydrogenase, partial [Alphaproteobacteria bacterium]|nr:NADP-dependent phosphogluconate dehydrogenase [Alphaproteobacteria bacterium]